MPLTRDPQALGANITELIALGHPAPQACAIAYEYGGGQDLAAGVCYLAGGSVLLLLRAPTAAHHPLTWCVPGGTIDDGETPEQAAIRESAEETGYTPTEPLQLLDWAGGFTTFVVRMAAPFVPTLNAEHLGYAWVPLDSLPQPMHPGCAATLQRAPVLAPAAVAMDERVIDGNGWHEVRNNPISRVGVFPYSGAQLGLEGEDAGKIFQVYRPEEELSHPDCVNSFKLVPWINDHTMLGPTAQKMSAAALPAEQKGVGGVIGENVYFKDGTLYGNIKAFSSTLAQLIAAGKRELSAGYRCAYEMTAGIWNGQAYDAIQRNIRGNHLALVKEGRMGPDVAVMDRMVFSFDATEATMADPEKKEGADAEPGKGEMTLSEMATTLKQIVPQIAAINEVLAGLSKPATPEVVEDKTPAAADTPQPPMAAAMDEAAFVKNIAARDKLAASLSKVVGSFDHSEMTLAGVVAYGCDKLALKADKGQEQAMLSGYLAGRPTNLPPARVAMDAAAKPSGLRAKLVPNSEA